jgi:hypothetical protein
MALLEELALDEVQLLQQTFELAEALEELLVHVLWEHFEDSLIVSLMPQRVGVVGEAP